MSRNPRTPCGGKPAASSTVDELARSRQDSIVKRVGALERSILACFVELCCYGNPPSTKELDECITFGLTAGEFSTDPHRAIFRAMTELRSENKTPDMLTLENKLKGPPFAVVMDFPSSGVVTVNLPNYLRDWQQAKQELAFWKAHEEMPAVTDPADRLALLDRMRGYLMSQGADSWRGIFHTWQEFQNAPPLRFAISGFLQQEGITLIGGLVGHGKTLVMLSMVKALLEGSPLFGHQPFAVREAATRVLYLIPESSLGPFRSRLELFRLETFVQDDSLLVRTLSSPEDVRLTDPRIIAAAQGADIFLDTAVRFMDGNENDVENARPFADMLFQLLQAGARSVTGAHHAPKGFETQTFMTLENVLRGSGDLGAMLSTAWGLRQIDADSNRLFVQNIKGRDFQPCQPFILEGRPHLDNTGNFHMTHEPGEAGNLCDYLADRGKGGRPITPSKDEKLAKAVELRRQGLGAPRIAKAIGVAVSTVQKWLFEYDRSQKEPN